jgi:hypothetical protein
VGRRRAAGDLVAGFASGCVLSNFVESGHAVHRPVGAGPLDCGTISIFTTQTTSVIIGIVAVVSPLPKPFHAKPTN